MIGLASNKENISYLHSIILASGPVFSDVCLQYYWVYSDLQFNILQMAFYKYLVQTLIKMH